MLEMVEPGILIKLCLTSSSLWLCLALLQESRVNPEIMASKYFENFVSRLLRVCGGMKLIAFGLAANHEFAPQVQQVVRQGAIVSANCAKHEIFAGTLNALKSKASGFVGEYEPSWHRRSQTTKQG